MRAGLGVVLVLCACPAAVGPVVDAGVSVDAGVTEPHDAGWRSLFNGTDLSGWQRYLGKPSSNPNSAEAPLGLENDPSGVFSVGQVDGEPAIHITGEIFGALISTEAFSDFELELEYRWGTRVFPPLNAYDSGLMYSSIGPLGAVNAGGDGLTPGENTGGFMISAEFQIAKGDVGSPYNLGPVGFTTALKRSGVELAGWNSVRIVVEGDASSHWLNGVEVARLTGMVNKWPGATLGPLKQGKLQLQSEGGEIYFRRVRMKPAL